MRIPTKMNFNNELYDTMGLFTINKVNFLIIKKDNNIIEIDTIVDNENLSFKIAASLKDGENISEHIFVNYLIETIKKNISIGTLATDDNVKETVNNINQYVNNSDIGQILDSCNAEIKNGDFIQNVISLLEYFDKKLENNGILDFSALTNFKIDDTNYIRYITEIGDAKIVIDTPENEQMINTINSKNEVDSIVQNNVETELQNDINIENINPTVDNTIENADEKLISDDEIKEVETIKNEDDTIPKPNNDEIVNSIPNENVDERIDENIQTNSTDIVNSGSSVEEKKELPSEEIEDTKKKKKKRNMIDILILLLIVGIICTIYLIYLIITVI